MSVMAQPSAPSIESLATSAAQGDPTLTKTYSEFLHTANNAHRLANEHQRAAMRQLAMTGPSPAEATVGIRQIMGW